MRYHTYVTRSNRAPSAPPGEYAEVLSGVARGGSAGVCALVGMVSILVSALGTSARANMLPDRSRTPGVIATSDSAVVCKPGYAHGARHVPYRVRDAIYSEYGLPRGRRTADGYVGVRRGYVIDHLVPLELGGANDPGNLWPQPRAEAKAKDRIEDELHEDVCSGRMSLAEAQRRIERDWQHAVPPVHEANHSPR